MPVNKFPSSERPNFPPLMNRAAHTSEIGAILTPFNVRTDIFIVFEDY
jgi:hypothetical protein